VQRATGRGGVTGFFAKFSCLSEQKAGRALRATPCDGKQENFPRKILDAIKAAHRRTLHLRLIFFVFYKSLAVGRGGRVVAPRRRRAFKRSPLPSPLRLIKNILTRQRRDFLREGERLCLSRSPEYKKTKMNLDVSRPAIRIMVRYSGNAMTVNENGGWLGNGSALLGSSTGWPKA
jgi:hypothetical protein